MLSKEELQEKISNSFKKLRMKRGFSKSKMARELYMDDKTWNRYEAGITSPTVPEFLWIYATLGEDALSSVLNIIYPDIYEGLDSGSSIRELRESASHYFLHVASDKSVRELDYLVFGNHGSNIEPQMQMYTAIAHLPLQCRIEICQLVLSMWHLSEVRGDLIGTDHVMPDIGILTDALNKATQSFERGSSGYSTSMD